MQILVIGGTGLVGSNVIGQGEAAGHDVVGTTHGDDSDDPLTLDKQDADAVVQAVETVEPDAVVDTAAFHAVDDCETERDKAFSVNAIGTGNVARAAAEIGAHFLYISTDYVFNGDSNDAPYTESDPVAPVNYYAEAKYAGEVAARIADDWTIFRPSVVFGAAGSNFTTWARDELKDGNEIGIVDDQVSRPTYAPDLARACVDVLESGLVGQYHATGPTSLSRYEFTCRLADVFDYDTDLVSAITSEELGQTAPRPADSSLDSSRLYEALGWQFRDPTTAFEAMASN